MYPHYYIFYPAWNQTVGTCCLYFIFWWHSCPWPSVQNGSINNSIATARGQWTGIWKTELRNMGRGYKKYIKPYVRSALEMESDVDSSEACKFISGVELNACCIKYSTEAKYSDGLACTKLCVSTCCWHPRSEFHDEVLLVAILA